MRKKVWMGPEEMEQLTQVYTMSTNRKKKERTADGINKTKETVFMGEGSV